MPPRRTEDELVLQHHDEDADTERGEYSDSDDDADEDTPMMLGQTDGAVEAADAPLSNAPPKPPPLPLVKKPEKPPPVAWRDLPKKQQLFVITMTRLSEPLVQTSLQSYMFYQLKWFDPTLPDSVISSQAGILHASFTAAQFITAMIWGRLADSKRFGRKTVLMIGLLGTCFSCIGFGFSQSFAQALFFRCLGGATNGNVGVLRTMISEIVREKKFQARAFILLPMTFNIGVIIGPILGGILSDPAGSYPSLFGDVAFFRKYPYATPNLLSAIFLSCAALSVWLCLEETHDALREEGPDLGSRVGSSIASLVRRIVSRRRRGLNSNADAAYTPLHSSSASTTDVDVELSPESAPPPKQKPRPRYRHRLPFRRIFTRNVLMTFSAHFFLAFHVGTFNALWFVFLSTPTSASPPHLPFRFSGGLGMPPQSVGMAMAILGVIGISLQLLVYPRLSAHLGTVKAWRLFLYFFPVTYFLVPYLAVVPTTDAAPPPGPKGGPAIWFAIVGVLLFQVLGRTFALPGQTILINNCTPHPSVLGTIHGLGQSVSSAARTIGPVLCGWLYGRGLEGGVVGAVWWGLAGVAVLGVMASWAVWEGDGHEIWIDGDEVAAEEEEEVHRR
ncbi:major facilitator superfamily transporter [Colletotrichum scovillei]|uniref:Major facilitator superfamily transporter n=1 Tax=Colletotrichum scovillei TaxID=1209932 RepID=A0A9P7RCU5_9PEZI|nr:major facilitator superfamily transporter [Colletotrichum scovillei]KAF4785131.1 major facilitator superfamily transporter [Colletotrichum scovillei]KAG7055277.1 major facilitator superfamily transporter [Colletotrichum scovillei]KAG7074755.1 major facilitator superfamily transporter [Colletotrichum scovillei]KAG7081927.1 major facilitator superfamily transporter [Colletotrichum scovillei]